MHKSGFVNIIGNPNVGKSTLMNELVGEKISIITSKSQTTRHRILGIVNGDDFQIVYSDTPGIIKPNYKLQEKMMEFVSVSFDDADVFLYVTDVVESPEKNAEYIERLSKVKIPVFCLINKIDLATDKQIEELQLFWENRLPNAKIFTISALNGTNVEQVFNEILSVLPEGPAWFPKDQLTDKTERFIVSEIIREKIFLNYQKEIPYSCEVAVEEFKESPDIIRIKSVIIVERQSQKGIIIGNKGAAIKKVGTEARLDIEKFFGKKVFLETFVKVEKDWRSSDRSLSNFGYNI
ncbi:MAG: GTPase Era [Bacteroidales bacterium]|jgi:GTP-binding protein Era|nr:GTPase Era [Bacteroidales bacterium]